MCKVGINKWTDRICFNLTIEIFNKLTKRQTNKTPKIALTPLKEDNLALKIGILEKISLKPLNPHNITHRSNNNIKEIKRWNKWSIQSTLDTKARSIKI